MVRAIEHWREGEMSRERHHIGENDWEREKGNSIWEKRRHI